MQTDTLMRIVFFILAIVGIIIGYHYFTTQTEMGISMKEDASNLIFGIFTDEYDNNAETVEGNEE